MRSNLFRPSRLLGSRFGLSLGAVSCGSGWPIGGSELPHNIIRKSLDCFNGSILKSLIQELASDWPWSEKESNAWKAALVSNLKQGRGHAFGSSCATRL